MYERIIAVCSCCLKSESYTVISGKSALNNRCDLIKLILLNNFFCHIGNVTP